jgi:hypothetical protein
MPNRSTVPCVYALLPNKDTNTYRKLLDVITSLVDFLPGLPRQVFLAKLCGCNFHHKQVNTYTINVVIIFHFRNERF